MSGYDLYLISPQLAMASLAILVILVDLVVSRKGFVAAVAFLGLLAPLGLALVQVFDINGFLAGPAVAELVPDDSVLSGSLSVDRFALYFYLLVLAATSLVVLSSVDYVRRLDRFQGEYFGLLLFSATGMLLLAAATELITIYIALELTTLPLAALAAFLMTSRSSEAGMKFLIIGALSSAIMLYGMALVFGFAGSTNLAAIGESFRLPAQQDVPFGSYAMLVGVVLMVVGFGFKIASVPFQMWVPDVYEAAPTPVVAFLSVASKAAGFAVLLRVFYTAFPMVDLEWGALVAALAAASMTVGNLVAIAQSNIRRLFGYSTIAHAGYILVGVAAVVGADGRPPLQAPGESGFATFGPSSVLFYLGAYTAANLTAFLAIIAISNRIDSDRIEDYAGMVRRAPFLAVALALALVALIGVPPTSLFIAKLYIFTAAVKSGLAWLAILGVINSVISAYYYIRIIRVMFLQPAPSPDGIRISVTAGVALAVAGAATLWIGVAPGFVLNAAESAVAALAGVMTP